MVLIITLIRLEISSRLLYVFKKLDFWQILCNLLSTKFNTMKNLIKILAAAVAITFTSCMATNGNYAYNDPYSQGYSDGYMDGYYRSPDGYWYAPNVVYLDNNGSYYRNGSVYNSRSRLSNNIVISPKRNSLHNGNVRVQQGSQRNQGMINTKQPNVRTQPAPRGQRAVQSTPQRQSQPQTQPQQGMRSEQNNGRR